MDRRFVNPNVIDYKIRILGEIVDRAAGKRITICLENLSENWEDLTAAFKELPGLHLTLDVGHAQLLRSETSAYGLIAAYPDRIKHIHLHDNFGGNSPENDLHLAPGKGIVDFEGIFDALRGIGYTGTATLELKVKEIKSCLPFVRALLN
jgi:sugar phosphate isomerase/epimerase